MPTRIEPITLYEQGWIVRVRRPAPSAVSTSVFILLHGWTGDDRTMDFFSPRLPSSAWLFAPRGILATGQGGFGWLPHDQRRLPDLSDLQLVTHQLHEQIQHWLKMYKIPPTKINLCGFSQGAALAYSYALAFPQNVNRVAGLAGFLPGFNHADFPLSHLQSVRFFIAHGSEDGVIAVANARQAVDSLAALGAQVDYCEAPVSHKVAAACLLKCEAFFAE